MNLCFPAFRWAVSFEWPRGHGCEQCFSRCRINHPQDELHRVLIRFTHHPVTLFYLHHTSLTPPEALTWCHPFCFSPLPLNVPMASTSCSFRSLPTYRSLRNATPLNIPLNTPLKAWSFSHFTMPCNFPSLSSCSVFYRTYHLPTHYKIHLLFYFFSVPSLNLYMLFKGFCSLTCPKYLFHAQVYSRSSIDSYQSRKEQIKYLI